MLANISYVYELLQRFAILYYLLTFSVKKFKMLQNKKQNKQICTLTIVDKIIDKLCFDQEENQSHQGLVDELFCL